MNPLLTHLNQIRPYINAVAINELAGTENLLGKHFHYVDTNGEKGQLLSPKRYFDVLSALIKAFGIVKIGRLTYYDADEVAVFGWIKLQESERDEPPFMHDMVIQHSFWDRFDIIEHFTAQQELTTAPPGS